MIQKKRILVIESENLLSAAVSSLLVEHPELEVMFKTADELANFSGQQPFHLDVIIIDESQLEPNLGTLLYLADNYPRMRFIVLGVGGNDLRVFDKQIVRVNQINDFYKLIDEQPFLGSGSGTSGFPGR